MVPPNISTTNVLVTNIVYFTNISFSNIHLAMQITNSYPVIKRTNVYSFTNSNFVQIRDQSTASIYPDSITVSNAIGVVDKVTVTFNGFTASWSGDFDAMLSSPSMTTVILMSDCGYSNNVSGLYLTFDDEATSKMSSNGSPV